MRCNVPVIVPRSINWWHFDDDIPASNTARNSSWRVNVDGIRSSSLRSVSCLFIVCYIHIFISTYNIYVFAMNNKGSLNCDAF